MRRGQGFGSILLALALFVPPLFNLAIELRRLKDAGQAPPRRDFMFGEAPYALGPPTRGRYVPARIIDFRSLSPLRGTYIVHFPPTEKTRKGAIVIGPHAVLAGMVVKVWENHGIALVRAVDDPGFRVLCATRADDVVLAGRGFGLGLDALTGSIADVAEGERVLTSPRSRVFPPNLIIGNRQGRIVTPAFAHDRDRWVYLWQDPDLEALSAAVGMEL